MRGEVNLCTIAVAANSLREKQTTVADIAGKSKREVERIVAKDNPVQALKEVIKPVVVSPPPLLAVALVSPEERYSLKFSLSRDSFEQFKARAHNRIGRYIPLPLRRKVWERDNGQS